MLFEIAKIPHVLECTKVWNRIRNKTFLAIMQMGELILNFFGDRIYMFFQLNNSIDIW